MASVDPPKAFAVSDMAAGKTPVSLLNEICGSVGCTTSYELVAAEGASHQPIFAYRLALIGDPVGAPFRFTASAKNKKVAKHLAAKSVLKQIVSSGKHVQWRLPGFTQEEADAYIDGLMPELNSELSADQTGQAVAAHVPKQEDNFVGKLTEMCQKKRLPAPFYEVVNETGEGIDRMFTVKVSIAEAYELGEGRNKKQAKRLAAEKMLECVMMCPDAPAKVPEDPDQAIIAKIESETAADLANEFAGDETLEDGDQAQSAHVNGQDNTLERIEAEFAKLDVESMALSPECATWLDRMCRARTDGSKQPVYTVLPKQDKNGNHQCLVSTPYKPADTSCGTGAKEASAQWDAARNALLLFKAHTPAPTPRNSDAPVVVTNGN